MCVFEFFSLYARNTRNDHRPRRRHGGNLAGRICGRIFEKIKIDINFGHDAFFLYPRITRNSSNRRPDIASRTGVANYRTLHFTLHFVSGWRGVGQLIEPEKNERAGPKRMRRGAGSFKGRAPMQKNTKNYAFWGWLMFRKHPSGHGALRFASHDAGRQPCWPNCWPNF